MENQVAPENNAGILYLALELSRKEWQLGFSDGSRKFGRNRDGRPGGRQEENRESKTTIGAQRIGTDPKLLRSRPRRILGASRIGADGYLEHSGRCIVDRSERLRPAESCWVPSTMTRNAFPLEPVDSDGYFLRALSNTLHLVPSNC